MEAAQRAAPHRDALCEEACVGLRRGARAVAVTLAVGDLQLALARQKPTPARACAIGTQLVC